MAKRRRAKKSKAMKIGTCRLDKNGRKYCRTNKGVRYAKKGR